MIQTNVFTQCLKTSLHFTVKDQHACHTGDLFYDLAKDQFFIKGVPAEKGQPAHIFHKSTKGPEIIHLMIHQIISTEYRPDGRYVDIKFKGATCSGQFYAWLEEWYSAGPVMHAIQSWEVTQGLAWIKS